MKTGRLQQAAAGVIQFALRDLAALPNPIAALRETDFLLLHDTPRQAHGWWLF